MLTVNIVNQSFIEEEESVYLPKLERLFDFFAAQSEYVDFIGQINLVLISDAEIHKLNKEYREKNKPTDVLSFPYLSSEEIDLNTDSESTLGEIFISKDTAIRDAKLLGVTLEDELYKLFIHGIFHILGYDHIDDNDFLIMKKKEDLFFQAFEQEK